MKRLDGYMEKLHTENWKHNLVSLYFEVSLPYDRVIEANSRSHALYLVLLDTAERIRKAEGEEKELLLGKYHLGIFDLCSQYDAVYHLLEQDMSSVKTALRDTFR